jgi:ABC-2 type transport system ATP-binding protein
MGLGLAEATWQPVKSPVRGNRTPGSVVGAVWRREMTEFPARGRIRHFTYNAQATEFTMMMAALAMLIVIEGACYTVALLFLTHGLARGICIAAALTVNVLGLSLMFSPLFTQHTLTAHSLTLHLGLGFKAVIPRDEITSVESINMLLPGVPGRVAYNRAKDMLVAATSRKGLILMQLVRPRVFKMWPRMKCETNRVLFNVDDPQAFLQALDETLPEASEPSGEKHVIPVAPGLRAEGTDDSAIRTRDLTKFYGQHVGVEDLNLTVWRGEIYGLLGVNGAGKTTTLKMLVGLMQPSRGHAALCGLDIQKEPTQAKACLGYLAETTIIYEKLTGREFLEFMAELRGIDAATTTKRIHELLLALDLVEWADQIIRVYSFGMRRKIALAGAVIHHPAVLILDEPFNGLDPRSSRRVRDYIRQTRREGITVLVSTHNLAIAEEICDRIGIIDRGHLIAEGTAPELRHRAQMEGSSLEDVFLRLTAEADDATVVSGT